MKYKCSLSALVMPSHARCAIGYCDNDKRYPDLQVKRSHVQTLCFHKWPKDENHAELWQKQVLISRKYVSPAYGGRATNVHIVRDSGVFWILLNHMMKLLADRGFKIREDLMLKMATLCISQSKAKSMQMLPSDVRKTSNIANVRIYVEQAIGRMNVFHTLKNELPINLIPLADEIVHVCAALCNLLPPLHE